MPVFTHIPHELFVSDVRALAAAVAADRPYGLIEASVVRDDASDPGSAWHGVPGFC